MVGVTAKYFQDVSLVVTVGVDVDAAKDAVAKRLVEGLGALEGAPACRKCVKVNLAGRLWGAECPDEDSGDEAEGEQEVPSDSRLDFVGSLQGRVWHLAVLSLELSGVLGSCCGWWRCFLGSCGEPAVAVVSVLVEMGR